MPDKKPTDNEIKKALERLENTKDYLKEQYQEQVKKCPYPELKPIAKQTYEDNKKAFDIAIKAIEEINRLQAEVIKEQNKNSKLWNERNSLQAENESMRRQLHNSKLHEKEAVEALKNERRYKSHDTKMINSEAINKFAERIKMEFYYEFDELIPSVMADKIDNISEEILKTTTKESYKPIPHSLGQYGSGTEVLYRCAKCGADFRILGKHETFCHGCGVKQDWENSPIYCSEQFKEMYNELVYKKHACISINEGANKELKQLLYRFYIGEIR